MARKKSINLPIGGMNVDDEDRAISPNDYRYALNIRNAVNAANKGKSLTNVLGNLQITKYILPYNGDIFPSGRNKCIGAFEDTKYGTVIFMVWNSNAQHQILRYYRGNTDPSNPFGIVEQVMQYDFGWTKYTKITSGNIVYGDPDNPERAGDLFYWCDPIPKKINLTKGNICNKHKSWNIYTGQTNQFTTGNTIRIRLRDFNNQQIVDANFTVGLFDTNNEGLKYIADQINANWSTWLIAEACECHLKITEVGTTSFYYDLLGYPFLMVPDNWYGSSLIDRFFDRCKWQPMNAPQAVYLQDTNYLPNYVQKKVFQFRLQYHYDDLEGQDLALGVWSQIPVNNLGCDGGSNELLNYIDVDFNDDLIPLQTTLVLLKNVRFVARELNTGNDRAVIDLEPCDFLDYVNGAWVSHFKFYNTIISNNIATDIAAKLFDNVPLKSNAESFVKNRMVEGGILEGYDAPDCPVATYSIEFQQKPNRPFRKIKGRVRIMTYGLSDAEDNPNTGVLPPYVQRTFYNAFPSYLKYPFWQHSDPAATYAIRRGGIFHDIARTTNNFPFFGGGGFGTGAAGDFGIRQGMEDTYDQRIPEAGFPVYAANTAFFTISKQISIGLPTDSSGALDTSTPEKRDAIGAYLYAGGDLYSEFELLVPDDDIYVIRLGSHWCSFELDGADKLEKGFAYNLSAGQTYQKTSTNVFSVIDPSGVQQQQKEFVVTVSGADVFIGDFLVMDLAPPFDALINEISGSGAFEKNLLFWQPINGYLVSDAANGIDINDPLFEGLPVEKTVLTYGGSGVAKSARVNLSAAPPNFGITAITHIDTGWNECCITDHNGYFFGIGGATASETVEFGLAEQTLLGFGNYNNFPISAYQSKLGATDNVQLVRKSSINGGDNLVYVGDMTQYFTKTLAALEFTGNLPGQIAAPGLIHCFVPTTEPTARENGATFIEGNIVDLNGNPLNNISAIYRNGSYTNSGLDGTYDIFAWSDMLTPNKGKFAAETSTFIPISDADRIVDSLIFSANPSCVVQYPNGQILLIEITPFGITGYNPDNPFIVTDFVVNEIVNPAIKARKRGGNYIDVIRYYDNAGRLCSCAKLYDIYIPFITEDIGSYNIIQTSTGLPYPAGSYLQGKPVISWAIDPNYRPPEWAAYYQLMRSKNLIYGRDLQWVANEVTYLSAIATDDSPEIRTAFLNRNATAVRISLHNIITYYSLYNTSNVTYTWEQGDRLRLISNRDGVYYTGLNEFEITMYDATTQSIYIRPDAFSEELLSGFYFEIYNPKSVETEDEQIFYEVGEVFKCTAPNTSNNQHGTLSGTFTNGDTYWHGRLIPVQDDSTNFAATYPLVVESASISDFYISEAQDIGRIGIIDPAFKQVYRPMLLRFTEQFIASTAINGLSSFNSIINTTKELDRAYGQIERLVFTQNNLAVIATSRIISNYIQRVTAYQASSDNGILSLSDQFFGTDYVHNQQLGTDFPASLVYNNEGMILALDNQNANCWRYAGQTTDVISDVNMINYFQSLFNDGVSEVVAAYYRYAEEYLLTLYRIYKEQVFVSQFTQITGGYNGVFVIDPNKPLPKVGDDFTIYVPDGTNWKQYLGEITSMTAEITHVNFTTSDTITLPQGLLNVSFSVPETISWFNKKEQVTGEKWKTFYSFTPEYYCSLGAELVSFVDGQIWIHDKSATRNNFYDQQFTSKLHIVSNQDEEEPKTWYNLYMENQQPTGFNWNLPVITNRNGQISRVKSGLFVKKEEFWVSTFNRDLNTAGKSNPIVSGREMRSTSLIMEMENATTEEFTLRRVVSEYQDSPRS